jgi:hypothetical protein
MTSYTGYLGFSKLRRQLQRVLQNRRTMAELSKCPACELHVMLRDLGLSTGDLQALRCSHPGPSRLLPQRLQQMRLDSGYMKLYRGSIYRDMLRVCASCKHWRRCERDLAVGDLQSGMQSYCLNAPTIDALVIE